MIEIHDEKTRDEHQYQNNKNNQNNKNKPSSANHHN